MSDNVEDQVKRVLGIVKPGDIIILESSNEIRAERLTALRRSFDRAVEELGVKIILLPHDVKVARIEFPAATNKTEYGA